MYTKDLLMDLLYLLMIYKEYLFPINIAENRGLFSHLIL